MKNFIIIYIHRSGSNVLKITLKQLLEKTHNFLNEPFNIQIDRHEQKESDIYDIRNGSILNGEKYNKAVNDRFNLLNNTPFLCKISPGEYQFLYPETRKKLLEIYKGSKIIFLHRENRMNQILSLLLAETRFMWAANLDYTEPKIKYILPIERISNMVDVQIRTLKYFNLIKKRITQLDIEYFDLSYEKNIEDQNKLQKTILDLGLNESFNVPFLPLNSYELIENIDECRTEILKHKRYLNMKIE